jgi:hypothetical protein
VEQRAFALPVPFNYVQPQSLLLFSGHVVGAENDPSVRLVRGQNRVEDLAGGQVLTSVRGGEALKKKSGIRR